MRSFLLLLFTALLTSYLSFSQEILNETFDNNNMNWATPKDQDIELKVENGKYTLKVMSEISYWSYKNIENLDPDEEDFDLETSITQIGGKDNYGFGLLWGMYSDSKTFHRFLISSNGSIKLSRNTPDDENVYMPWTSSTLIKSMGDANIFKVEKRANIVRCYLNGEMVYQGGDFAYYGSKLGFYVGNQMEIAVDYIKLTKFPKVIDVVPTVNPNITSQKLGPQVNTAELSEVAPVVSPDGKTLFCVRKGSPMNTGSPKYDDIWFSKLDENGNWTELQNMGAPLNNAEHNFVISVSPDNNTLLIGNTYKEDGTALGGGLSITHKTAAGWEIPKKLEVEGLYNDDDYVAYFMANDNKTLLLSIENKDGFGQKDIYVSFLREDNTWSKPKNLGSTINNWGDETEPFLASDLKTLYFSTEGLPGYGNSDVFVTKRLDDTWTNWSKPMNLGKPINTAGSELGFYLAAKGDLAYLSSGGDICVVPNPERPEPVVLISGTVYNKKTNKPMGAVINYSDIASSKNLGNAQSHPVTGNYTIVLPLGRVYSFLAQNEGYYSIAENIDVQSLSIYKEIKKDLYLTPIEKGETIRLNNLFFETNKAEIKSESFPELNRLISILNDNPDLKIEILGHTDDVGSDDYNLNLSKERAKSVVNYLTSKGIPSDRLSSKGFGETKPEVPNSNDENRAINRRVEFRIL
ncbi:MAG: OmpA family protein [Bacteroidetes bacterium]|nr:MAG: OmpA family protein [Bacteroidota bacterium]